MARITFIQPDGSQQSVDAEPGVTVMEEDMLDFAFDVRKESRLSCQIKVTDALDGLVLRIPAKQF